MFELPKLNYGFDALEPYIDTRTMEIHHGKHHAMYVTKLNDALTNQESLKSLNIEELLSSLDEVPEDIRITVRNNGGGHYNHTLFWESMKPGGAKEPSGQLADGLKSTFGSIDEFKAKLTETAINCFGSGWGWLVKNGDKFEVYATGRQDSPIMEGKSVLLGVDVWEHAYYLKYQNRRPDYIEAWWNTVNWDVVAERLR